MEREKRKQNKKLIQKIGFFFWTTQKVMRIEQCVVFCFLFLKFKKIRFPFSLLILILLPFSTWFQLLFLLFFSSVIWKRKTPSFFLVLLGTKQNHLFSSLAPTPLISVFLSSSKIWVFPCLSVLTLQMVLWRWFTKTLQKQPVFAALWSHK